MTKKFSKKELQTFRRLGLEAILNKIARGFNYYPISVEQKFQNVVSVPVKYGHRSSNFIMLLRKAVDSEFGGKICSNLFSRTIIYQWLKGYKFPSVKEGIRIYDIEKRDYVSEENYDEASDRLVAEGEEFTVVFVPPEDSLVDVVNFINQRGSFYLTDEKGNLLEAPKNSKYLFKLNSQRISDDAYMIPMIVTSHSLELIEKLPAFGTVKKLYKIKGGEEISIYLDKTIDEFIKRCRIRFRGPVLRLGNKLFRDFINFEEDPRLSSFS